MWLLYHWWMILPLLACVGILTAWKQAKHPEEELWEILYVGAIISGSGFIILWCFVRIIGFMWETPLWGQW